MCTVLCKSNSNENCQILFLVLCCPKVCGEIPNCTSCHFARTKGIVSLNFLYQMKVCNEKLGKDKAILCPICSIYLSYKEHKTRDYNLLAQKVSNAYVHCTCCVLISLNAFDKRKFWITERRKGSQEFS